MKITSISPSSLELYASCPFCFWCKTQKHPQQTSPAMRFGTRLHKAIERYHKELLPQIDDDLLPYLEAYQAVYDQAYQTAEEFWKVQLFDTDITLNLKIDLIKDDYLIDHKTSGRPYTQEYIDSQRQVTAYSWAWSKLYTEREKGVKFNIFYTNPKPGQDLIEVFETTRNEDDFAEWELWVRDILKGIESDYFEVGNGKFHNYEACHKFNVKGGEE